MFTLPPRGEWPCKPSSCYIDIALGEDTYSSQDSGCVWRNIGLAAVLRQPLKHLDAPSTRVEFCLKEWRVPHWQLADDNGVCWRHSSSITITSLTSFVHDGGVSHVIEPTSYWSVRSQSAGKLRHQVWLFDSTDTTNRQRISSCYF